jgi:hypothetical protein
MKMYLPYLRGRQNELLCLRELLDAGKLSQKVIPIIEPVKFSSTLFSTLSKFVEMDHPVIVVRNPKVGLFRDELVVMKNKIDTETDEKKKEKLKLIVDGYQKVWNDGHLQRAYLVDDNVITKIENNKINAQDTVMINLDRENYHYYEEYGEEIFGKYTVVPKGGDFEDIVEDDIIVLDDSYRKAKRNIDYIERPDETFSRNHLVYEKRGFVGFSDFSIVGKEFEESGFAPTVIAIHIMYFGIREEVKIHHFVSERHERYSDLARKFEEAMIQLTEWENFSDIPKTIGLNQLIECYEMGKFPGLGVIKKYSLMHHIQMMGDYLEAK